MSARSPCSGNDIWEVKKWWLYLFWTRNWSKCRLREALHLFSDQYNYVDVVGNAGTPTSECRLNDPTPHQRYGNVKPTSRILKRVISKLQRTGPDVDVSMELIDVHYTRGRPTGKPGKNKSICQGRNTFSTCANPGRVERERGSTPNSPLKILFLARHFLYDIFVLLFLGRGQFENL